MILPFLLCLWFCPESKFATHLESHHPPFARDLSYQILARGLSYCPVNVLLPIGTTRNPVDYAINALCLPLCSRRPSWAPAHSTVPHFAFCLGVKTNAKGNVAAWSDMPKPGVVLGNLTPADRHGSVQVRAPFQICRCPVKLIMSFNFH